MSKKTYGCLGVILVLGLTGYFSYKWVDAENKRVRAAAERERALRQEFARAVAESARDFGFPRMIDDYTRADSVEVDGFTVVYNFTYFDPGGNAFIENSRYWSESMKDDERRDRNRVLARLMDRDVRHNARRSACVGAENLLRAGGRVIYRYEDFRALPITSFTFTKKDCAF